MNFFSYFYWDPHPEMLPIELPFLHRGILWYGFFFALGFFIGYFLFLSLLRRFLGSVKNKTQKFAKSDPVRIAEKVTFYLIVGVLIGARLGDVLFYQEWGNLMQHPLSLFKIWEGGLASHGGAVGSFIALWLVCRKIPLSFLQLLDLIVIPTALAGVCIRIGNFFGQEILGTPTTLAWGVIFGHPAGGEAVVPRHPVQLYEALWYGCVFLILWRYCKRHPALEHPGRIAGLFFILIFAFRFCIEWVKVEQSRWIGPHSFLTMGQYLSLPLIAFGLWLLYASKKSSYRY